MKNSMQKLLRLLERSGGETIKLNELYRQLTATGRDDGKAGRKKGKARPERGGAWRRAEIEEAIAALVELGAVHLREGGIVARHPFLFRGRVSLSPRGLAFVALRGASPGAREVFVAPGDQHGALPGDEALVRLVDRSRERFEGIIVDILQRSRRFYRLKLESLPRNGAAPGVVLDAQARIAALVDVRRLPADILARLRVDQTLIVRLTGQELRHQGGWFQEAIFERFEDDSDMDADYARILMKYNLEPVYPASIEIPDENAEPSPETVGDWKKRKDLRNLYTITIDGADSKDFDDALSLEMNRGGLWKLYVHIADVSYYVKKGSALDQEAERRATSYYLANRVTPMLPPGLSENLCSLVAGKDRLAFTAELHIDPRSGAIRKSSFYKAIIRVDRRLTYDIAEEALDQAPGGDEAQPAKLLHELWRLARLQREKRIASGRIDLDVPESKLKIGPDDRVQGVEQRQRQKSSMLIEECMLSANIAVAQFLRQKRAQTLYRVHEPMDDTKVVNLNAFFESYNIPFTIKDSSPKKIQKAMEMVRKHIGEKRLERVFHMALLRSFMQAAYRPDPRGHWGLAFSDYCHFTSPIRRYPDLVVHRSLEALISKKKAPYTRDEVDQLGFHCSEQERNAMDAERDIFKLKVMRYLEQRGLRQFRAMVTGFRPERVYLEISDAPAEAIVPATHLTNERELPLPDRFSVYIKRLGRPALMGEEWLLELERLDFEEMRIYCRPVF